MNKKTEIDQNRRDFMKKAAYTAPAIVTMAAIPSFASAGSGYTQSEITPPQFQSVSGQRVHRQRR